MSLSLSVYFSLEVRSRDLRPFASSTRLGGKFVSTRLV